MNYETTILGGCSLGESWMPYFNYSADTLRLQMSGGGNGFPLSGILNHFLLHDISKSTVIVQFTGIHRQTLVTHKEIMWEDRVKLNLSKITGTYNKNKFPLGQFIHNNLTGRDEFYMQDAGLSLKGFTEEAFSGDHYFRNLVSVLCMLAKLGADVYAFRGWIGCCGPEVWEEAGKLFKQHGVTFTDMDYITESAKIATQESDWQEPIRDKKIFAHPTIELGCKAFKVIWAEMNEP